MTLQPRRPSLTSEGRRRPVAWLILAAVLLISMVVTSFHGGRLYLRNGDSGEYLDGAYHIYRYGTFSQQPTSRDVAPAIGREPGYSLFLAMLMAVDSNFSRYRPECLSVGATCGPKIFRIASWANLALAGLTGATMALVGYMVLQDDILAVICGAYLLLNLQLNQGWAPIMSDHLAVWLVSLTMLAIVWAWRSDKILRWSIVGLALAALTLTKAVFLVYAITIAGCALAIAALGLVPRKRLLAGLAVGAVVYCTIVGAWIVRNKLVSGEFRFTDYRGGIALNTRVVFDEMTPMQYVAAFVYWTRGFGDSLARRLFRPDVVSPFNIKQPGGFYDRGQNGYWPRVYRTMQNRHVDSQEAMAIVDHQLERAILTRPITHILTTIPLFYRGIWIDEFIVIGLPAFVVVLWRATRDRDWLWLILLSIGAFNLLFYALFSLNIPRYQMTAIPAIALAVARAAESVMQWRTRRRAMRLIDTG
jgi:hypothetical protein